MYLSIDHANGYIEEKGVNKYLVFHSTDKNKELLKKYNDVFNGIKNKIKEVSDSECDCEKDYMKIELNSDDKLPLNKPLKFCLMTITIRCVFSEGGKFYPQLFLHDTLYQLNISKMLEHNGIDISEGIDVNKTNLSKECDICHYWFFKDIGFKYEDFLWNGCHDLTQKAMGFNVAIVYVKRSAYRIHFWYMCKNDAINITNGSNLVDKSGVL